MLIVTTSIAKEPFCLDVSDKYYQKSASVTMGDTELSVLTPKFQMDDDLEKKEGCINRLLILKKKGKVVVNNKAILNNIDYQQDPFEGMKREKNTLSLEFEFGSIDHAYFKFNFKMINGRFQLSSREYSFFNKCNLEIYLKGVDYKKKIFHWQHLML